MGRLNEMNSPYPVQILLIAGQGQVCSRLTPNPNDYPGGQLVTVIGHSTWFPRTVS